MLRTADTMVVHVADILDPTSLETSPTGSISAVLACTKQINRNHLVPRGRRDGRR